METIAFRSNDDILHPKVEIPPIIVLDEPHYPSKVENQIHSSTLRSQSNQVCYSRASSQSSRASQEGDQELALEFQHQAQLGILIRPRMDHHGVIESRDSTSKTTKESSSSYNDLVNKIWIKNNSLQIPTKPEAVVTIQASYRGHLARKDLKKQHQSATTLQSNFRGYRTRNQLKRWSNEMETIAFESSDYNLLNKLYHPSKVEKQINSSNLGAQSSQVFDNRPSSCSSCASQESDRDSALAYQHWVQLGIVIRPRLGHDGVSESRGLTSKTTKRSSSSYNDLVCCYGVDVIGKKNTLLEDLTKEEAVVTVQAGYRGHLARKNLKRQHQCATTIQVRKHLKMIFNNL
uniref:Uncharacterized protein n=1 Tax=Eptatretus burgeri TaxID=7764 RepID=A0A8C4NHQ1_EPTBU